MARVFVENLSKVFDGQVAAVDGLTLDVADRELMVIVGPSGCGKTTTLRMIAGLEEPTSGTITIDDRVVNCLAPKDRDIAMVFQNYALYPHMTVFGNMAFGLKMRKFAKADIKKRVKKAATLLEIEHLFNRKPNELSGGQRQRVAVGRAIVREPKVFLFDEPLSNLDARMRLTARAELKSLHHKLKTTTIYVTHDQQEAMTLGDRICVMYNGQVQQVGSPIDVYNKPANRFVAGFLGAPPMNFFTGKVEADANTLRFRIGEDMVELPLRLRTKMADHHDMKMVLGIRPENMSFSNFTGQDKNTISATVGVVEPLGIKTDIYLTDRTGTKFIINTAPFAVPSVGDLVKVHIDLEKIHLFEQGETGRNVTLF